MRCENKATLLDHEDLLKGQIEFRKTLTTKFLSILRVQFFD